LQPSSPVGDINERLLSTCQSRCCRKSVVEKLIVSNLTITGFNIVHSSLFWSVPIILC